MKTEFLSVGSCLPEFEQADTASLLVDGKIMVDTGVVELIREGVAKLTVADEKAEA